MSGRFRLTQKAWNNRVNGHSDFGGIYIPNLPSHTGEILIYAEIPRRLTFNALYGIIIDTLLK